MRELLPPPRAVPLPRRGRSLGWKIEGLNHVGGRAMRAPTTLRKIATVRCVCNAGLHHCNGQMYLQPSIAPSYTVGARIARPFVPNVITTTLREGARRVIGATAKPLYPIDGKAAGFDRRNPKTSLFEGGGPPAGGGRSPQTMIPPRSPTPHSSCEFGFFFICFICPRHMMFFFKNHQVSFRRMSRSSAWVYGESISHSSALMRRMPS